MIRIPDTDELLSLAHDLGLDLTRPEVELFQGRMIVQLEGIQQFENLLLDEQKPATRFRNRDSGYLPTRNEDPLNVFIRKCLVKGAAEGSFAGKTVGVKDNISVAGIPLTCGSHFLDGYVPDFDATIVSRVLDAGGTIIGKLNMEDFSFGGPGFGGAGDFGRVLNPHAHDHVTGGSSSGSAAAVAAGQVDIAFGGDQAGSIRIPAAWCGIVGLKATYGLIPNTGVIGLDRTIDYVGPMARRVQDIALAFEVIAGPDRWDVAQATLPRDLPAMTPLSPDRIQGLTIGVLEEGFNVEGLEDDVKDAVLGAADIYSQGGAIIQPVSVPSHNEAMLPMLPIFFEGARYFVESNLGGAQVISHYPTSLITLFGRFRSAHGHEMGIGMKLNLVIGEYLHRRYQGRFYAKAQNIRATFRSAYDSAFSKCDLLLMPTVPVKAPKYVPPEDHVDAIDRTLFGGTKGLDLGLICHNTGPFNLTGHPAISIPCAKSTAGLPIGMMLVAPFFREDLLMSAGLAFQEAVDWDSLVNPGT